MIFGSRNTIAKLSNPRYFAMGNYDINFVRGYVYLGVTIDDVMSLVPLVITVKQRISDKIFMLRKISRLLTLESAVLAYILPIIDYAGFLIIACRKDDKRDLPVLQNDTLRICNMSRISDRVSIEELHANCKIVSLEQRRRKQLLGLMFLLSKDETFCMWRIEMLIESHLSYLLKLILYMSILHIT